jgi:hypothetical protein
VRTLPATLFRLLPKTIVSLGVDPSFGGFALLRRMEETGVAEVVSVTKKPPALKNNGAEQPLYAIQAKMYLPASKYSNGLFRVKISKPVDLAGRVPSAMDHGIFKFDSYWELKVGKLLEIHISPA